jgi:hypothetical protein
MGFGSNTGRQVNPYNKGDGTTRTYHGSTAKFGGSTKPAPYSSSMQNYGAPFNQTTGGNTNPYSAVPGGWTPGSASPGGAAGGTGGSIYNSGDADYIRNLPTAYTPEQSMLMKTAATNVQSAGDRGMTGRIRELMAAQGLSGSGSETGALTNAMLGSNRNLSSTMSGIDIANANQDLANRYAKGGMLNQLMGTGLDENKLAEMGRQFDVGQYNDLYKWGNETDYQRYLDRYSKGQYNDQMNQFLRMLGLL